MSESETGKTSTGEFKAILDTPPPETATTTTVAKNISVGEKTTNPAPAAIATKAQIAFNALPPEVQAYLKLTTREIYELIPSLHTKNGIINEYEYNKLQNKNDTKYLYVEVLPIPDPILSSDGYMHQAEVLKEYKQLYRRTIPGWSELELKRDAVYVEINKNLAPKITPLKEQLIKERNEKIKNIRKVLKSQETYNDQVSKIKREYEDQIEKMKKDNTPTDLCVLTNDYQRCKDIFPHKNPFSYEKWPENLIPSLEEIRAHYPDVQKAGKKRATKKSAKKSRKTRRRRQKK